MENTHAHACTHTHIHWCTLVYVPIFCSDFFLDKLERSAFNFQNHWFSAIRELRGRLGQTLSHFQNSIPGSQLLYWLSPVSKLEGEHKCSLSQYVIIAGYRRMLLGDPPITSYSESPNWALVLNSSWKMNIVILSFYWYNHFRKSLSN